MQDTISNQQIKRIEINVKPLVSRSPCWLFNYCSSLWLRLYKQLISGLMCLFKWLAHVQYKTNGLMLMKTALFPHIHLPLVFNSLDTGQLFASTGFAFAVIDIKMITLDPGMCLSPPLTSSWPHSDDSHSGSTLHVGMLPFGRRVILQSSSLSTMSDGDVISDYLCFLIHTLKKAPAFCVPLQTSCFPNCVMEPFHSSASVLNPEKKQISLHFLVHIYLKMKTASVRGRSGMLMLTHPHAWSCQCVMQRDLYVVGLRECFRSHCSVRSTPGGIQRDMHLRSIIKVTLLSLWFLTSVRFPPPSHPNLTRVSCMRYHIRSLKWAEAALAPARICSPTHTHRLSEVRHVRAHTFTDARNNCRRRRKHRSLKYQDPSSIKKAQSNIQMYLL